jgi:hypothetical protein
MAGGVYPKTRKAAIARAEELIGRHGLEAVAELIEKAVAERMW